MYNNYRQPQDNISDTLGEIKESASAILEQLAAIRQDYAELSQNRNVPTKRICDRLDDIQRKISAMNYGIQELSAPTIMATYKVSHPEFIDTIPLDLYNEVTDIAQDIKDDIDKQTDAVGKRIAEISQERDSVQSLADYVALLKKLRDDIVSRRERVESLKTRRRQADKDSNEQKNASILIVKVRSLIEPYERLSQFILGCYFKKRRRIMSEIWRTTSAIEEMYDVKSEEYKSKIPAISVESPISSALRHLADITKRHDETFKANTLVQTGQMTALERRKILAGLKS